MTEGLVIVGLLLVVWLLSKRYGDVSMQQTGGLPNGLATIIYRIRLQAFRYNIPSYIPLRIAWIESNFNVNAVGRAGEVGIFQITPAVISDYNLANNTSYTPDDLMGNEIISADIACWLLRQHLDFYNQDVEKAVKAYNTGRGGINSQAAESYWRKFCAAATLFPED